MQSLYESLPYSIEFTGKTYGLKPCFDNVLQVFAIYGDKVLTDMQKAQLALSLLVKGRVHLRNYEKCRLINAIFDLLVDNKKHSADNVKSFDFMQDSQYIYASFVYDYGIDLFSEQGQLHWWKFIALFNSLSEYSKMSQIISIRLKDIPAADKYNAKEIESLVKAKQFYALEVSQEERQSQLAKSLFGLKNTLLSLAK